MTPTPPNPVRSLMKAPRGFSLLEMIGVLAVLAVLASMLLPVAIRRIDLRVRTREKADLITLSNALASSVVRERSLPNHGTWAARAGAWSGFAAADVTTNPRQLPRVYFQESGCNITLNAVQTASGWDKPVGTRVLVLSSVSGTPMSAAYSGTLHSTGGALNPGDFEEAWRTPEGQRPGCWSAWNVRGEDVLLQRIDYAPLFRRLVLVNRDGPVTTAGRFNIDDRTPANARTFHDPLTSAPIPVWDRYYLEGTVVSLCDYQGNPVTDYVLNRDISFVYENGKWRAQLVGVPITGLADDFDTVAQTFMKTVPSKPDWGANPEGIVTTMYTFMLTYTYWANFCPHFSWRSSSSAVQVPEWKIMLELCGQIDDFSAYIMSENPNTKARDPNL